MLSTISTCGCITSRRRPHQWLRLPLVGAGFGYETGSGLRVDGTVDYLNNDGLTDGGDTYALHLKGTVALANVYYDIPLSGGGSAGGGFGADVGAGAGLRRSTELPYRGSRASCRRTAAAGPRLRRPWPA